MYYFLNGRHEKGGVVGGFNRRRRERRSSVDRVWGVMVLLLLL
jgi:hypothetical protein